MPSARAGAFLQKPDEGVLIATTTFSDAVRAYDGTGRLVPIKEWRKFELTTYAEYGVTDWLTAVVDPSLFVFRQGLPGISRPATVIGEAGARVKLVEWGTSVLSAQTVLRGPFAGAAARPFADTTRFVQVDARLLWGRGFEMFGWRAFTNLELGFRSNGNFGPQARIDATLGLQPTDNLVLLFQSFTATTPYRIGGVAFLSQKFEVSGVYWVTPSIGVQIGGLFALRGVNSAAERGAFTALWYRF